MCVVRRGNLGTAVVSDDDRYRYYLTRDLCAGKGSVAFVMLNPSKANHCRNDDTVERCISLARELSYRTLLVGNLYALCATDPEHLKGVEDPIGPCNDRYLHEIATCCSMVVAAWGDGPWRASKFKSKFKERANAVLRLLWETMPAECKPIRRLNGLTNNGHPRHPLPRNTPFIAKDLVCWYGRNDDQSPPQVA